MAEAPNKRTPSAWSKECLRILQGIHPDYQKNREIKGRFLEFIRPDPSGLLISQNFVRIHDVYYLCFALSLTRSGLSPYLYSPFIAGSRFDDSRTIWRQFSDDLCLKRQDPDYPKGVWSSGPWYSNTLDNLARGFCLNEQYLYPHYRQTLAAGKERLIALFQAARLLLANVDPALPLAGQLTRLWPRPPAKIPPWLVSGRIDAAAIARGGNCYSGFGSAGNAGNLDELAPEVIVFHFAELFFSEAKRLDEIISIIQLL